MARCEFTELEIFLTARAVISFGEDFLAPCKDLRLAFGNQNGVFEMSRWFAIGGDDCPAVRQNFHAADAHVDHRLDGEDLSLIHI